MSKHKKTSKLKLFRFNQSLIFIFIGVILILTSSSILIGSASITHYNLLKSKSTQEIKNVPTHISIPTSGIDLKVEVGGIIDGEWILNDKSAFYLPKQYLIEGQNSTIIYAHKRVGLFLNLTKLKIGDTINLTSDRQDKSIYKVVSVATVDPNSTESLRTDTPYSLILITCSGWKDDQRLVVKAIKIG